jgi:hypothetical protein
MYELIRSDHNCKPHLDIEWKLKDDERADKQDHTEFLDKLKQDTTFQAALNKQTDQKLNFLKQKIIQANKTPEYYFDAIAESFKYEKKPQIKILSI